MTIIYYHILFLLAVHYIIYCNCVHLATIPFIHVQNESLTITSFQYNPTSAYSDWIDRVFGTKSIFYPNRSYRDVISNKALTEEELELRSSKVKEIFELPQSAYWPSCSFELLGFGMIDQYDPLKESYRNKYPSFGRALVKVPLASRKSIPCFYRGLYENWRFYSSFTKPNYWSVLYYCPIHNETVCADYDRHVKLTSNKLTKIDMVMELQTVNWRTSFHARLQQHRRFDINTTTAQPFSSAFMNSLSFHKHHRAGGREVMTNEPVYNVGVCLAIPYSSSDESKDIANGAILHEWVLYYLKLGFKIFIYDRDGLHKKYIYGKSRYQHNQYSNISPKLYRHIIYHNYTIRGILDTSTRGLKYDNSEPNFEDKDASFSRRRRFEAQGHDKTYTLTHCRMEAKALYGIDNIIVADFDEFLYCPAAGNTAQGQSTFIAKLIDNYRQQSFDQITLPQRYLVNITASPRDCVINQVQFNQSVLNCFGPFQYYMGGHSIKSIHLGHKCPLTGYHQSCPTSDLPRSYDCLCVNKAIRQNPYFNPADPAPPARECSFLHLSTNIQNYQGKYKYTLSNIRKSGRLTTELLDIFNS